MSIRQRVESGLGHGLALVGLHRLALGSNGLILAFHRVNDVLPEDGLTRSARKFERFCRFFKSNFDVVALSELVTQIEQKKSVAGKVAITFDDGYRGNFEVAAPILRRLSLPSTFYIVTRFIGTDTVPWWDRDLPQQPGWMSWDQVRTLSREGFDIGAHTRTHVDLGTVEGAEARDEIAGSRQDIIRETGRVPEHFAYPYGQRNNLLEGNRALVKDAGFRSCVSCYGGQVSSCTEPFMLRRVPVAAWYRTPEQLIFELLTRRRWVEPEPPTRGEEQA